MANGLRRRMGHGQARAQRGITVVAVGHACGGDPRDRVWDSGGESAGGTARPTFSRWVVGRMLATTSTRRLNSRDALCWRKAPHDVEALRLLARSTARLGRDEPANAMFARLGSEALRGEDLFLLGRGLMRSGRVPEATAVWEQAIGLEPNHGEALEQLIAVLSSRNRLIEASGLAERLARLPGFELRAELSLASIRAELGDPAGAAALLHQAMLRAPRPQRLDRASRHAVSQAAGTNASGNPASLGAGTQCARRQVSQRPAATRRRTVGS